jgi:hypothetical protein
MQIDAFKVWASFTIDRDNFFGMQDKKTKTQSCSFSNRMMKYNIHFPPSKKIDQHVHVCRLKRKYARGLFYVSHAVAAAAAIVLGQRSHHTGTKAGAGIVVQGTSYTIALIS